MATGPLTETAAVTRVPYPGGAWSSPRYRTRGQWSLPPAGSGTRSVVDDREAEDDGGGDDDVAQREVLRGRKPAHRVPAVLLEAG
jgi:hypothetical protein